MPITSRQPGMFLTLMAISSTGKQVAIGTDPLLEVTGCGNGSRPVC